MRNFIKKDRFLGIILRLFILLALVAALFPAGAKAQTTTTLTIQPITWNVIGLDSNDVSVGPNHFPIGARVCNTGASPTVATVTFNWDSGTDTYISLRDGTASVVSLSLPVASLPSETGCRDAYFEVEVTRDSGAYNQTRRYTISATDLSGTVTTPSPRELFVERLISQSRNSINNMLLDGNSVAAGGVMNLMVGQTYVITLVGNTATNGYEQIESFINFPNTIFQVLDVETTYTADTSSRVTSPDDKLYGDGCLWVNNPLSPNYRSCVETGKAGGDIEVDYTVKILSVPGAPLVNPEPLSILIYDFSGSSYHYNADYSVQTRFANIINATVTKSFAPKIISPGGTSTLSFTVTNPGPQPISSVNFVDNLPVGVSIAANQTISYIGCGTPSPASVTAGATSLSFSGITIAALSTCTFSVGVTSSAAATYTNTSGNLFIGAVDTGSFAQDALVVSSLPAAPTTCSTRTTLAAWTFENYTASTAYNVGPFTYSSKQVDVATAQATYGASGGSNSAIVNLTTYPATWPVPTAAGNNGNSWGIRAGWLSANPVNPATATTPYFAFQVDARNYGAIGISLNYDLEDNWSNAGNWYILFSTDNSNWTSINTAQWNKKAWTAISGSTAVSGNPIVYFRVFAAGAQNATATMYIDEVQITGCPRPVVPTLSKAFSPVTIAETGGTPTVSNLTFTFANPNSTALTGVGFFDTLPSGLVLNTPNGLSGPTCTTGSISGQTLTALAGTRDIVMSGATLAANSSCTFTVSVVGDAGYYTNVSSNITSAETGPNPTGTGTASLTIVAPPVIAKSFGANTLITGNTTSLNFTIVNPNRTTALSAVAFTDLLPAGIEVAAGSTPACGGTLTTTDNNPARDTAALSGGSLAAGAACTFSVTVTGSTVGLKDNSVAVTATGGGINLTGNTATASLLVKDLTPALAFSKKISASATGLWTESLIAAPGSSVYYQFTVENTGDVALDPVSITDDTLDVSGCNAAFASAGALPVAVAANENHIRSCVVGPVAVGSGRIINTAFGTGIYGLVSTNSDPDSASYLNGNFGHLPSSYQYMNYYAEGGAFHLNGNTFLGGSVDTNDSDGTTYEILPDKATDDGISFTDRWISGFGTATLNVTCETAPCYVYAWFDWNQDNDFNDADETQSWTVNTSGNSTTNIQFEYPGNSTLPQGYYYLRFRAYAQQPANPQPYGVALTAGGNAIVGEIEDYQIYLGPTSIELIEANARPAGATPVSLLAPLALVALLAGSLALGWKLRQR